MKTASLFLSFVLAAAAHAETTHCPAFYPSKAMTLSDVPPGHQGSGLVRSAKLSSAYISTDPLHTDPNGFNAVQLSAKKVKGGWNTEDRFTPGDVKWLVCVYGGDGRSSVENPRVAGTIEWWEKLSSTSNYCTLRFREVKSAARTPSDWTATATCE